jgi:hypothetical protein
LIDRISPKQYEREARLCSGDGEREEIQKHKKPRRWVMRKRSHLVWAWLMLFLSGCAAPVVFFGAGTAAGVTGYKYYRGSLSVVYQAPYMETWDATLKAVENMQMQVQEQKHDLTTGKIVAKRADKKGVHISVKYMSSEETEVVIRVGFLGDQEASMAIKEEIRKVLFKA